MGSSRIEDVRAPEERLQDLDALLLAHGMLSTLASGSMAKLNVAARSRTRSNRRVVVEEDASRASAPRRGRCSRQPSSPGSA